LIYSVGSKFTKDPKFYTAFGDKGSTFSLADPKLAKIRKDILNPLFSRKAIRQLEDVVQEKVYSPGVLFSPVHNIVTGRFARDVDPFVQRSAR